MGPTHWRVRQSCFEKRGMNCVELQGMCVSRFSSICSGSPQRGHCIVSVLALNGTSPLSSPPHPPVPTMLARVPSQPGSLPAGRQNHRSATCSATVSPISSFSSSHFILIFISHKTGVDLAPSVAWLLVAICDTISFLHISHLYQSLLRNNANEHPVCKKSVQI